MRQLLLLLIHLSLYSSENLLDIYQKEGTAAIEKIFSAQLATKDYWKYRLQDVNTSYGYFESINYLLSCDKNNSTLSLYYKDANNTFQHSQDFTAFTGEKDGDKEKEGDLKTPIGVYKLLKKLDNVDSFYGPLAFVTSYPNTYDRAKGKSGSGIWVHGLPLHQDRDDYTKGCIAINNNNLVKIEEHIKIKEALVYIDQEKMKFQNKETLIILLAQLYQWKKAWSESDIELYLSFYAQDFKSTTNLNKKRFSRYKTRIFKKNEYKQIHFNNINIIRYPMQNKNEVYLISFNEIYQSSSYRFNGPKELYVEFKDDTIKIIAEK